MNNTSRRLVSVAICTLVGCAFGLRPGPALSAPPEVDPSLTHREFGGRGTATIDGVLSPGEWSHAASISFDANLPGGGTTPATLFLMNDGSNLYAAVSFLRSVVDFGNSFDLSFDGNDDGVRALGDDALADNPDLTPQLTDDFLANVPPCPAGGLCDLRDVDFGGTNDGVGVFHNDGTTSVYEVSHPLNSGDSHDFALTTGNRVGVQVFLRMINGAGFGDTTFPSGGFLHLVVRP